MKRVHHAGTVEAAADLVRFWKKNGGAPEGLKLEEVHDLLGEPARVRAMAKWAAGCDDLKDVVVDVGLASAIVERVSNATCFQHFTYCGALGPLEDGAKKVDAGGGYCWDCDPFMPWFGQIANISTAGVSYDPSCGVLTKAFLEKSHGAAMIAGDEDWDNELYPSAVDCAEHYGSGARGFRDAGKRGFALQSLSYAIHLLQDMAVPHHVLCTVGLDHAEWEAEMAQYWRLLYGMKGAAQRDQIVAAQLAPMVADLYEKHFRGKRSFRSIGAASVALTAATLPSPTAVPGPSKPAARATTAQAMATTLAAVSLYA